MKTNTDFIFNMKVFQQGHEVATLAKPLGRWQLGIQNSIGYEFSIPLFSIPTNSLKIHARKDGVALILEGPWSGLIQAGSHSFHKPYRPHEPTIIDLKPGDLGSFQFYGLSFAFKIIRNKKLASQTIKRNPKLQATPFADWFNIFAAPWVLGISIILASLLLGGAIAGLFMRKDLRPEKLSDLENAYTLNFISPMALETLPEALNTSLNAEPFPAQTIKHYQAVSDLLMGEAMADDANNYPTLYPSSLEVAQERKQSQESKIGDFFQQASTREQLEAKNPNTSQIMLFSALWGSRDLEIMEILGKIDDYQNGLGMQYRARAEVIKEFRGDQSYDYAKYFVGQKPEKSKPITSSGLEKIKLEGMFSPEERLYMETASLAQEAKTLQNKTAPARLKSEQDKTPQLVLVKQNFEQFAFAPQSQELLADDRFAGLQGIPYGSKPKIMAKAEELAIGEIDPRAVEKTIEEGQFRLRLCFESALRRNQNTKGTIQWRWRIDINGRPQGMQLISSSIQDDTMIRCMRDTMMTWIFPKPTKGSVLVNRSFEFQADAG